MRHLKRLLSAILATTSIIGLAACSSMHPDTQLTVSKTRPVVIKPMLLLNPAYPLVAWDNDALPSKVTACFNVDRYGRAKNVTVTHISIPDSGDMKLDHKIRVALGANVRKALRENRFWPVKAHGEHVESPRVCQDFRYARRQYYVSRRGSWTISRLRPKYITPMVRMTPLIPEIARANNAVKSKITVCFKLEPNGQLEDVKITRLAIPNTGNKKLNRKIEAKLGAAVLGAVEDSMFFPHKVEGKPVETPHVCEDYTLRSLG